MTDKVKLFFTHHSFAIRHAFSVTVAVIFALIIHLHITFSESEWIVLAAFLVGQTTYGTPLRQGLSAFFAINLACLLIASLQFVFPSFTVILLIAFIYLATLIFILSRAFVGKKNNYPIVVFAISLLADIPVLSEPSWQMIRIQVMDIAIGSLMGIICNRFLFRMNAGREFSKGITPVLKALINYEKILTKFLIKADDQIKQLTQAKFQVEKTLVAQQSLYPEWVYEVGFNPGLRSGFRFYLLTLERVTEIFFSLDYFARQTLNPEWVNALTPAIKHAMEKNMELLNILNNYFSQNILPKTSSDFTSDISELEENVSNIVPSQLELLDISPDYLRLTAIVRDIKDLRELLLQLVMALPGDSAVVPAKAGIQ